MSWNKKAVSCLLLLLLLKLNRHKINQHVWLACYLVESYVLSNVRGKMLVKNNDVFYGDFTLLAGGMNNGKQTTRVL